MVLQSFLESATALRTTPSSVAVTFAVCCLFPLVAFALRPRTKYPLLGTKNEHGAEIRLPRDLPSKLPVLGNLIDLIKNDACRPDWITSHGEQFKGEPVCIHIPGQPLVIVLYTPEAIEDVLKTQFDRFPKGQFQRDAFQDLLGHGVFAVDGVEWLHQRKTASNLFTARALRETMAQSIRRCTVILERVLQKAADTNTSIDVYRLMTRFTMDSFAEMGFGLDMNTLEAEEEHPFQYAFDSAGQVLVSRFQRPVWLWKLERWLNIGQEGLLKRCVEVVDRTVLEMVTQRLARHHAEGGKAFKASDTHKDIISVFLSRVDDDVDATSPIDVMNPKFLRDLVVNFLLAGRDTTAQAMSWLIYNLSNQPQIAEKIRDEIRTVLPELADGTITTPSMEQVQRLTYLEATLRETLRLHPSVPLIPKSPDEDTVLCDGTFIPKGSTVLLPMYCMARLETVWGPDAREFKPERWIDPVTGKIITVSAYKFFSFNAGPRMCLGMNLAMLEMKIVMASLLSRFRIELEPEQTVTYENALTLAVKGEMRARVTDLCA